MTEWGVVGVLITIAGLFVTVAVPIIKLNGNITRMTTVLDRLQLDYSKLEKDNTDSHRRLWEHNNKVGDKINEHDKRISTLELMEGKAQ